MQNKPKLMIIGHARHGKDTVCEYLRDKYGFKFQSSSEFCVNFLIWPLMPQYSSAEECFNDRENHRQFWYDTISGYNKEDPSRLGKELFATNDIYCGIRNGSELQSLKKLNIIDCIIWVDASKRKEKEEMSSCTVTPEMTDIILDNNGTLDDLYHNIDKILLIKGWI